MAGNLSSQPSGDVERQETSERRETSAAAPISPAVEEMGQEAIDAELEENDIQRFREQLRRELDLEFPKANRKEKEQYLDKVETELRDTFDKVCRERGCWHRIQGILPSLFGINGRFIVRTRYTIRKKNGKKTTTDHFIQFYGFRPKTPEGSSRENEAVQKLNTEEQESFSPQASVQRVLGEISFPELHAHLAELAQMSENFPENDVRRYLQEMARIAAELTRAGDDPERLRGIAEEGQNRLRAIGGDLEEEIPAALMRDRGMSIEEFRAEADDPTTPLGAFRQTQRFYDLLGELSKPSQSPSSLPPEELEWKNLPPS